MVIPAFVKAFSARLNHRIRISLHYPLGFNPRLRV
ncbi:hypothetical protein HCH_02810 [Hahella chejuensis KCTC 2396]|uniref:Uncharacterized protein n=1 Tax=Hahella chejuensis (strain KCTC 2396) TaxID=349521 RepID=Q2SID6_HAHCH|nr:hypothetical protein HCH_02810 [Hahella chejuensis KCTC 2396]